MNKYQWIAKLKQYEGSDLKKSIIQIITSVVPYLSLLAVMFYLVANSYSYWWVLGLSVIASGFYLRIFILLHDCSHNSFFKSLRANTIFGHICGFLTYTPFLDWQRAHNMHHSTVSKLEYRNIAGDIWTMTVDEYNIAPKWEKIKYRFYRHPINMFAVGPLVLLFYIFRFPKKYNRKKDKLNIFYSNLLIAALLVGTHFTVGIINFIIVQLPVMYVAVAVGIWLFYIQHQYEDVYWSESKDWNPIKAALEGSSFYKLPGFLRWISGNIGYHHIHHLKPRIPNYNLKQCQSEVSELQDIPTITFFKSFKSLFLHLWDEKSGNLIKFSQRRKLMKIAKKAAAATSSVN